MANRGSGDFRRGRNREEEESRRGSGRERGDFGSQGYSGGREGYSEPGRGEYGRGDEEGGSPSLYGQGRRPEEPWRPGQAGFSETPSGGGYQERQPGPTSYRRSTGYRGYGSPDWSGQDWGYSGSRPAGLQSSNFDRGSEEFGGGRQGYAGTFGFGYGSGWTGGTRYGGGGGMTPRGRFSGKGPKGYSRSDDRIKEDVSDRLEQHGEIDASEIEVSVMAGEVTLAGTVEDRWTKRLAEDTVEDCPGVKEVHNRLRVQSQGEAGRSEAGRSQSQRGKSDFGGSSGAQGARGSEQGSTRGTERSRGSSTTKSSTRS